MHLGGKDRAIHYVLAEYVERLFRLSYGIISCSQSKKDFQNYLVTDGKDHIFKGTEI